MDYWKQVENGQMTTPLENADTTTGKTELKSPWELDAQRITKNLESLLSGDEWLAETTLFYLEHTLKASLADFYWRGIKACASQEVK